VPGVPEDDRPEKGQVASKFCTVRLPKVVVSEEENNVQK
jgi:hypothetical protein